MNRPYFAVLSRAVFLLAVCMGLPVPLSRAQGVPPQGSSKADGRSDRPHAPAFEVVSIRPGSPNLPWSSSVDSNGDEYRVIARPLGITILNAYLPWSQQSRERLPGAPPWIWNEKFDFVAKVAPGDLEAWHQSLRHAFAGPNPMLETMLQAALRDRCKLTVHRVPAMYSAFALVVSAHGLNRKRFSASRPGEVIPDNAVKMADDGRMVPILSSDDPVTHFYETSMASFAATMSGWGAPVEDRTGLTGRYDFALRQLSTNEDPSVDWDLAALGLKLEPIRMPTENIIIDHIEYPSPN